MARRDELQKARRFGNLSKPREFSVRRPNRRGTRDEICMRYFITPWPLTSPAFAQKMTSDDLKWINQCISGGTKARKAGRPPLSAGLFYVHEREDDDDEYPIRHSWEKANPEARQDCEKQAGWKYSVNAKAALCLRHERRRGRTAAVGKSSTRCLGIYWRGHCNRNQHGDGAAGRRPLSFIVSSFPCDRVRCRLVTGRQRRYDRRCSRQGARPPPLPESRPEAGMRSHFGGATTRHMDFLKPRLIPMNRRRRIYEGKAKVLSQRRCSFSTSRTTPRPSTRRNTR